MVQCSERASPRVPSIMRATCCHDAQWRRQRCRVPRGTTASNQWIGAARNRRAAVGVVVVVVATAPPSWPDHQTFRAAAGRAALLICRDRPVMRWASERGGGTERNHPGTSTDATLVPPTTRKGGRRAQTSRAASALPSAVVCYLDERNEALAGLLLRRATPAPTTAARPRRTCACSRPLAKLPERHGAWRSWSAPTLAAHPRNLRERACAKTRSLLRSASTSPSMFATPILAMPGERLVPAITSGPARCARVTL